jgi:cysteinyl-tRNA synthetase
MSKSLGNFFTIREIFEKSKWPEEVIGEALRYFLFGTHYRSPLDFSDRSLHEAKNAVDGFYDLFMRLREPDEKATVDSKLAQTIERCRSVFREAMDDDFNTPMAIAELQRLRTDVNKLLAQGLSTEARIRARGEFRSLGQVLGLFKLEKWHYVLKAEPGSNQISGGSVALTHEGRLTDAVIEVMVTERNDARRKKDFKKADEIRKYLAERDIIIEDRPDGTSRWKR